MNARHVGRGVGALCGLGGALALLTAAGCGGSLAPVRGQLLAGGQPVPGGTIIFHSARGQQAVGELQPDGSFTLTTYTPGDGAVIGQHKVVIQPPTSGPTSMVHITQGAELNSGKKGPPAPAVYIWPVPQEYSHAGATPLTAEVKAGRNELVFDITPQR